MRLTTRKHGKRRRSNPDSLKELNAYLRTKDRDEIISSDGSFIRTSLRLKKRKQIVI